MIKLSVYHTLYMTWNRFCVDRRSHFSIRHLFTSMSITEVNSRGKSGDQRSSGKAKYSKRSCYANLQLSRTIKTIIVNLHSMTCCYICFTSPLRSSLVGYISGI